MSDYIFVLSNQNSDLAGHLSFQKKKNYLKPCNSYWDTTRRSATNTLLLLSNKVKVQQGHKLKMTKFLRKYFTVPYDIVSNHYFLSIFCTSSKNTSAYYHSPVDFIVSKIKDGQRCDAGKIFPIQAADLVVAKVKLLWINMGMH